MHTTICLLLILRRPLAVTLIVSVLVPLCHTNSHPLRRTGLAGRGDLRRWGPNHEVVAAVTRWARDANGVITTVNGTRVLEVLVAENEDAQVRTASEREQEQERSLPRQAYRRASVLLLHIDIPFFNTVLLAV